MIVEMSPLHACGASVGGHSPGMSPTPASTLREFFLCSALSVVVALATSARAALIAYEPFDYPADIPLVGQTNGIGFNSPWQPGGFNARLFDLFRTHSGKLEFPGLAMKGSNHVSGDAPPAGAPGIAGVGRLFSTNLATPGATFYLSFLHQPDAPDEYASVVIGTGDGKELSVGKSGSIREYHISQRGGIGRVMSGVEPVVGKAAFLVVKMEFKDGEDRFTLFVNPTPGKPEPASATVKEDFDLEYADMIFLYSRASWSVDEIRLGTTWADVTPASKPPAK
jgi:hypothetical protein